MGGGAAGGFFIMHSFLRNECVTNKPHKTSAGRLAKTARNGNFLFFT